MSSLVRRMQRAPKRVKPSGLVHFGDNVGKPPNNKAKDLLARLARLAKKENI